MKDAKRILTAIAMFILMSTGHLAGEETVADLNRRIADTRMAMARIRADRTRQVRQTLRSHPGYIYTIECKEHIDSLRRQNREYLARAVQIARRGNPFSCVPENTMVFMMYSGIPQIATLRDLYNINEEKIKRFEYKTDGFQEFRRSVENRCDSVMHAKIDSCQILIDSLLDKKAQKIR